MWSALVLEVHLVYSSLETNNMKKFFSSSFSLVYTGLT